MRLNLNNERKTIIILSLFFVIILVVIFAIILPTIQYIKDLNDDTGNLKSYLEKIHDNTHSVRISKAKIEDIKKQTADYDNYLFYHGDELKLINILETIASNNKVIQKIDNSDLGSAGSNLIHISLTLNGDYQNLLQYILDLEKSNYFIQIEHLQLSPFVNLQDSSDLNLSAMKLDLILYVSKH